MRYLTIATVIVCLLFIFLAHLAKARAHEWYPVECCHALDCAPVDRTEWVAGATFAAEHAQPDPGLPLMVVTTVHGSVIVPPNFRRQTSKDGRMHACIHGGKLLCLFLPPAM